MCATATGGCGKIWIDNDPAERFVVRLALAVLDTAAVRRSLSSPRGEDPSVDLRRRIVEDERRYNRLGDDYTDEVIDKVTYERQRTRVGKRLATNRAALADLLREQPQVIETGGRSVREVWDEHDDVTWRRDLLGRVLESLTVEAFPAGAASTLTRRKAETEDYFAARALEHRDDLLRQRLRLAWRTEPVDDDAPRLDDAAFEHLSQHERVALWASRMEANRPVQLTGVELIDDASALLNSSW